MPSFRIIVNSHLPKEIDRIGCNAVCLHTDISMIAELPFDKNTEMGMDRHLDITYVKV